MSFTARHYQRSAVDAIYEGWTQGTMKPLVIVPTGGGKSFVIAMLVRELLAKYPRLRIEQTVHVKELITQNYLELTTLWPFAPAGIYSASVGRRDAHSQILFSGIQSVYNKPEITGLTDLLIIDEAHLVPPEATAMYGQYIAAKLAMNPEMRIIGLTATGYRLLKGTTTTLTSGPGALFQKVVYEVPLTLLIDEGYLVPPISRATEQTLNVTGVGTRGGEYIAGQLEKAVDIASVTERAVAQMVQDGRDRKAWIAFCSGIDHSQHVVEAVRKHGISCEVISSKTSQGDRDSIIADYKAQKIRCLASMNVLTTGFNVPAVDLIALLRPTKSTVLYVQMIGRGLRPSDGKSDCLVLDYAKNIEIHGPVDLVKIEDHEERAKGEAPVKICDECKMYNYAGASRCKYCGHDFPPPVFIEKIVPRAAVLPLLSRELKTPEWIDCQRVTYRVHKKEGSPDMVCADFVCGLKVYSKYLLLSHDGFARDKSRSFWTWLAGRNDFPKSTADAMTRLGELRQPTAIRVKADGKFWNVFDMKFEAAEKENAA